MALMERNYREYLRLLPLWAALLPLVTFNVSYLIAVAYEHVPACITYLCGLHQR